MPPSLQTGLAIPQTIHELTDLWGSPSMPIMVDLRLPEDVKSHPQIIHTSQRASLTDLAESLCSSLRMEKTEPLCFVCHKGLKISQAGAALANQLGHQSTYLEGGMVAWLDAQAPSLSCHSNLVSAKNLSQTQDSIWIIEAPLARSSVFCAWIVKRFLNRRAVFLQVQHGQGEGAKEHLNADGYLTSEHSVFALLEMAELQTPSLLALANEVTTDNTLSKSCSFHPVAALIDHLLAQDSGAAPALEPCFRILDMLFSVIKASHPTIKEQS